MYTRRSTAAGSTKKKKKGRKSFNPWKRDVEMFRRCQPKGPPLPPVCRHSCSKFECSTLDQAQMETFHKRFYYTRDKKSQDAFILKYCQGRSPKRRSTVAQKKRRFIAEYYVPTKEGMVQVCKSTFVGILRIKRCRVDSVMSSSFISGGSSLSLSSGTGKRMVEGRASRTESDHQESSGRCTTSTMSSSSNFTGDSSSSKKFFTLTQNGRVDHPKQKRTRKSVRRSLQSKNILTHNRYNKSSVIMASSTTERIKKSGILLKKEDIKKIDNTQKDKQDNSGAKTLSPVAEICQGNKLSCEGGNRFGPSAYLNEVDNHFVNELKDDIRLRVKSGKEKQIRFCSPLNDERFKDIKRNNGHKEESSINTEESEEKEEEKENQSEKQYIERNLHKCVGNGNIYNWLNLSCRCPRVYNWSPLKPSSMSIYLNDRLKSESEIVQETGVKIYDHERKSAQEERKADNFSLNFENALHESDIGHVYESRKRRMRKLESIAQEKENLPFGGAKATTSAVNQPHQPKPKSILIIRNLNKDLSIKKKKIQNESKSRFPLQTIQFFKNQNFIYGKT